MRKSGGGPESADNSPLPKEVLRSCFSGVNDVSGKKKKKKPRERVSGAPGCCARERKEPKRTQGKCDRGTSWQVSQGRSPSPAAAAAATSPPSLPPSLTFSPSRGRSRSPSLPCERRWSRGVRVRVGPRQSVQPCAPCFFNVKETKEKKETRAFRTPASIGRET